MYRYRDNSGCTQLSLQRMKHLSKIGQVTLVRGYEYIGRYHVLHHGILVKGTKGSCRYNGFCWGYGGEGPRGLVKLLAHLGVRQAAAEAIAFEVRRLDEPGVSWEIEFANLCRLVEPVESRWELTNPAAA